MNTFDSQRGFNRLVGEVLGRILKRELRFEMVGAERGKLEADLSQLEDFLRWEGIPSMQWAGEIHDENEDSVFLHIEKKKFWIRRRDIRVTPMGLRNTPEAVLVEIPNEIAEREGLL